MGMVKLRLISSLVLHLMAFRSISAIKFAKCIFSRHYGYVHVHHKTIPHLLGHGSIWRKCFVVYPTSEAKDCLVNYQWLTGTRVLNKLPPSIDSIPMPNESIITDFKERLTDYIMLSQSKRKNRLDLHLNLNFGVYQALLSCLWQLGHNYSHIRDSYWSPLTKVTCYWRRHGINYITFTTPSILYTSLALDLWSPTASLEEGSVPVPDINPSHLGLFERSFDKIDVFGGNKSLSFFPMAHTLIIKNSYTKNTPEQTMAHALLELFAQAAAQTVQNGYSLDSNLDYPLATQAILTDGQSYTLACYQLNTLDLRQDSSSSISNVLWYGPTFEIWDKETNTVNEECAILLLKFLLNCPLRKKPEFFTPVYRNKSDLQK